MKKNGCNQLLFLTILISVLFAGCTRDPPPALIQTTRPELLSKGSISGLLFDFQGNPVVSALTVTDKGYSGISHNEGAFIISDLPAGNYDITFIRYGYLDSIVFVKDLFITENRSIGEVILRYGLSRVRGYVLSSQGAPVPNATVVLAEHPYSTKTDNTGFFSMERISPEVDRIMAAQDDEGWGQALLSLKPGADCEITVFLHPAKTGTIKGTIYNENNEPDTGAIVTSFGGLIIDTSVDGTFSLHNLPCALPLSVSSGTTHKVSSLLIPENDTVINIDLKTLQVSTSGTVSIVERQIFALQNDRVIISADVRNNNDSTSSYDSVAVFLWRIKQNGTIFDTSTSSPFLPVQLTPGFNYQYGVITVQNDTLDYVPVTLIETPSVSEIRFVDSSFSPSDTTITVSDSLTLSWNAYDMNGRPLEYSVYFGGYSISPPSFYRGGIVDTFLVVKPVGGWQERKYRWQVEARSSKGSVKTSELIFTINN